MTNHPVRRRLTVGHSPRPAQSSSLLRVGRILAFLGLLLCAGVSQAQFTDPAIFSFDPDPPQAHQSFMVTLRVNPCVHGVILSVFHPLDREVVVTVGRIEVTTLYWPIYICAPSHPAALDQRLQIDPIPAGTYELVVYGQDVEFPDDPNARTALYATSVTVVPTPQAVSIPVFSPVGIGLLCGIVLLLGGLRFRRGLQG